MYSKIQILSNISKFTKCEQNLINNIILEYQKGKLNSYYDNAISYFVIKSLIAHNNCFKEMESLINLYDKIQDICNKCEITLPSTVSAQELASFGIITENGIQINSETGSFLIIE